MLGGDPVFDHVDDQGIISLAGNPTVKYATDAHTTVTLNGKQAALPDLKKGDHVTFKGTGPGGPPFVESVEATRSDPMLGGALALPGGRPDGSEPR